MSMINLVAPAMSEWVSSFLTAH